MRFVAALSLLSHRVEICWQRPHVSDARLLQLLTSPSAAHSLWCEADTFSSLSCFPPGFFFLALCIWVPIYGSDQLDFSTQSTILSTKRQDPEEPSCSAENLRRMLKTHTTGFLITGFQSDMYFKSRDFIAHHIELSLVLICAFQVQTIETYYILFFFIDFI